MWSTSSPLASRSSRASATGSTAIATGKTPSIEELRGVAWLATTEDGLLAAPAAVFRYEHDLAPHLPVLHPSLRGLTNLLDALDVRHEPSAEDAIELLLRLAAQGNGDEPVPADRRKAIRACWRRLAQEPEASLEALDGQAVALGADDRLYRCDELLLNDVPSIATEFSEDVRRRLVRQTDAQPALRRAGVRDLSTSLRSRVVDKGEPVDGRRVAERILKRQPQLARVVAREGGRWVDVLEFARSLEVAAYEWVTVDRYLDGFDEGLSTAPVAGRGSLAGGRSPGGRGPGQSPRMVRDRLLPPRGPVPVGVALRRNRNRGPPARRDRAARGRARLAPRLPRARTRTLGGAWKRARRTAPTRRSGGAAFRRHHDGTTRSRRTRARSREKTTRSTQRHADDVDAITTLMTRPPKTHEPARPHPAMESRAQDDPDDARRAPIDEPTTTGTTDDDGAGASRSLETATPPAATGLEGPADQTAAAPPGVARPPKATAARHADLPSPERWSANRWKRMVVRRRQRTQAWRRRCRTSTRSALPAAVVGSTRQGWRRSSDTSVRLVAIPRHSR